jgi:Type IV secretion system pilin
MNRTTSIFAQIKNCPPNEATDADCFTNLPTTAAGADQIRVLLQFTFGIISAIAVIVIIVQGYNFVLSGGESEKAKKARNALIYAAVGLAVSLSAQLIVSFFLKSS